MIIRGNLILVLMEDALRAQWLPLYNGQRDVLILVLMEDALRDIYEDRYINHILSLNPCSNGRCSARQTNIL